MQRDWPILLLLTTITVAVFVRVVGHEFVNYDDYAYVTLNPTVQQGLTWHGVKWAFAELHGEVTYWHPITWLSHMLDSQFFGLKPGGHHFSNVVFHTINVLLLFVLFRTMTGQRGASAVLAALFALHPFQVDSVAWVAERKNVLSTMFWLLALLAYVCYVARPGLARYMVVFALMALGLMAKPTLVTIPCVMLLLDFWPLGRTPWWRKPNAQVQNTKSKIQSSVGWLLIEKLPFLALSAISSVLTIRAHQAIGALVGGEQLPFTLRLANAVVSYALYLRKLVWPSDLSVFYMHPGRWPTSAVVMGGLVVVAVSVLAALQAQRRPYLLVGWLWFLGVLVPFIGIVQAHVQAMADRFAYVPIIGIFVMIVWAANELPFRRHGKLVLPGLAAAVLAASVVMTSLQLRYWRNSIALFEHAIRVAPGNHLAHVMLGNAFAERDQNDAALREYQEAVRLRPNDATAWQRAGVIFTQQGKLSEAISHLEKAVQLAPALPEPRRRLGLALLSAGRVAEARGVFLSLIPLMPQTADAQRELADMLAEGQQVGEAIEHYRIALRLKPDFAIALNNLAWLRATAAHREFRDGNEAVQFAERACALTGRRNPSFVGTLAAAYAEVGRFPDAMKTMQEALTLSRALGAEQLIPVQTQMLIQFQSGKPFHAGER